MKILLFVEGLTEMSLRPFLKRWLDSQELPQRVEVKAVNFEGVGKYLARFARRARQDLGSSKVSGVLGVVDLYQCPLTWPPDVDSAAQRYEWAKRHLEQQVGHRGFRQHFAVHETEAWLLSDPTVLPAAVRPGLPSKGPESVNFNDPPSKRLARLYRKEFGREYKKTVDGPKLFQSLNPVVASEKCPHLKLLLDDLLNLARSA